MAIFNMSDSSINEYLNETSARTKYVRMKKKEYDEHQKEQDKLRDLAFPKDKDKAKSAKTQVAYKRWKKLNNKAHDAFKKAAKYTTGTDNDTIMKYRDPSSAPAGAFRFKGEKYSIHKKDRGFNKNGKVVTTPDYEGLAASAKGKDQFNKDFAGKGNKDPYESRKIEYDDKYSRDLPKDKKEWRLEQNKKVIKDRLKAKGKLKEAAEYIYSVIESASYYEDHDDANTSLREAAEYILSVLDEMDYIEESEKK
jgi:hypothetical protein